MAAAHTFFQANPDHTEMKQNLDYYRMMAGVEEEHFKDLEAREHMVITHTLTNTHTVITESTEECFRPQQCSSRFRVSV